MHIKRALLCAIVLTASSLVPLLVTSSPAAAACGSYSWKKATWNWQVNSDDDWTLTVGVLSAGCTSGRIVEAYTIQFDPKGSYACDHRDGGDIDRWRANPNILGDWNPGTKEINCVDTETRTMTWYAPAGTKVYAGDPASERCIGSYVTAVVNNLPDITRDMPSLCII